MAPFPGHVQLTGLPQLVTLTQFRAASVRTSEQGFRSQQLVAVVQTPRHPDDGGGRQHTSRDARQSVEL